MYKINKFTFIYILLTRSFLQMLKALPVMLEVKNETVRVWTDDECFISPLIFIYWRRLWY